MVARKKKQNVTSRGSQTMRGKKPTGVVKQRVVKKAFGDWPSLRWYALLSLTVLVVDQLAKVWTRSLFTGESITVVPGFLYFSHVENTGASFGMFQGQNALLLWVGIAVTGLLVYGHDWFKTRCERVSYALLFAGVVGNVLDRLFFGSVTDFIDLGWWPVFNIADSALVVGVTLLVCLSAVEAWKQTRKREA